MRSTTSYPRVSIKSYRPLAEAAIARSIDVGMELSLLRPDSARRDCGLLGELAASLYLFHNADPWFQARNRQYEKRSTPDLYPYTGLEIKTLCDPSHRRAPVDHMFRNDVDTFYVRFSEDNTFEMIGWLRAAQAQAIWQLGQTTFTDGWRFIPVECLSPAETCPWRVE